MKVVLLLIVGCIYAAKALPQKSPNHNDEDHVTTIIGGNNAKRNQFPYMVSIRAYIHNKYYHVCGAVIISKSWLLSAAGCFPRYPSLFPDIAVAGSVLFDESDKQISAIQRVVNHPNWREGINNIALAKLGHPLRFSESVQPVQLPKSGANLSGKAVVAGWGRLSADSWSPASALQYLEVDLITNEDCNKILTAISGSVGYPFLIKQDRMCALPENAGESICHGDFGGPLVQNNTLIGIAQDTAHWKCNQPLKNKPYPNIFSRVGSLLNFITLFVEQ